MRTLRIRAVTLIEAVLFIAVALGVIIGGLVFYTHRRSDSCLPWWRNSVPFTGTRGESL
jgi:hypothetical protein